MNMDNLRELSTLELVEKLIEYDIGENERLIYLKYYIKNGKPIFETDKRFLERCIKKLEGQEVPKIKPKKIENIPDEKNLNIIKQLQESEIGDPNRLESIKHDILDNEILNERDTEYLKEKFEQFAQINENEKTIRDAIKTITALKREEIGNAHRLESINEQLERRSPLSISDVKYFNEKAKELKKLRNEQIYFKEKEQEFEVKPKINTIKIPINANKNVTNLNSGFSLSIKISDLIHASAWAIFVIWFLGLFLIDLYPVQDYLLGIAIGLGVGVVAIHKIKKKTSRLFH